MAETQKIYSKRHYEKHKERLNAVSKARYHRNPGRPRELHLRNKFGLSLLAYETLLGAQNGRCAICGREAKDNPIRGGRNCLVVDHDHTTGVIRGLLCSKCNVAIGFLSERLDFLDAAKIYLAKYQGILL